MSDQVTTTVKKTTRTRKTTATPTVVSEATVSTKAVTAFEDIFNDVIQSINESKAEFLRLQREIEETKRAWVREQQEHEVSIAQRNQQEELARKREQEAYEYETKLARRKAEDEFLEKKARWERELAVSKEEIEKEREELVTLRERVSGFDMEKTKAVKEAQVILQKELNEQITMEKKLREQEVKAEKELLALKITTLTQENTRMNHEIEALKKALTDATAQLKDVAVKVIESSNTSSKQFTGSTE